MKRLYSLLFAALFVVCFGYCRALSENYKRVYISDTDNSFEIPTDWYYGDRNEDNSKDFLSSFQVSHDYLLNILDSGESLCLATSPDLKRIITLMSSKASRNDFNGMTDTVLLSIGETYANYTCAENNTIEKIRILKAKSPFVKIFFTDNTNYTQDAVYITIYKGIEYCFIMRSDIPATYENESIMDHVASSFVFEKDVTYITNNINDVSLSISIPNDMYILSETERQAVQNNMMNYLFYAISQSGKFRVHVDMINEYSSIRSLNALTDDEKEQMIPIMEQMTDQLYGKGKSKCDLVEINGITYVYTEIDLGVSKTPFIEISYTTILDNKMFSIAFDPEITNDSMCEETSKQLIATIMDRIVYDEEIIQASYHREENSISFSQYHISKPDITIKIPTDFYTFWREMPADAYSIYATDYSIEDVDEIFAKNPELILTANTYDTAEKNIDLIISDLPMPDLIDKENKEIWRYIEGAYDIQWHNDGLIDTSYSIIETDVFKFIFQKGTFSDSTFSKPYGCQIMTFINGKEMTLIYTSSAPITESDVQKLQEIVFSIVLNGKKQTTINCSEWRQSKDFEPFTYNSDNLSFIMPSSFIVFDDSSSDNDLFVCTKGWTKSTVNYYLSSLKASFMVNVFDSDVVMYLRSNLIENQPDFTYDLYNDIQAIIPYMESSYGMAGLSNIKSELICSNVNHEGKTKEKNLVWIKTKGMLSTGSIQQMIYMTIINGKQYIFDVEATLISSDLEKLIDKMIQTSILNY